LYLRANPMPAPRGTCHVTITCNHLTDQHSLTQY